MYIVEYSLLTYYAGQLSAWMILCAVRACASWQNLSRQHRDNISCPFCQTAKWW